MDEWVQGRGEWSHPGERAAPLTALPIRSSPAVNLYVVFTHEMRLQHLLAVDVVGVTRRERVDVIVHLQKGCVRKCHSWLSTV